MCWLMGKRNYIIQWNITPCPEYWCHILGNSTDLFESCRIARVLDETEVLDAGALVSTGRVMGC